MSPNPLSIYSRPATNNERPGSPLSSIAQAYLDVLNVLDRLNASPMPESVESSLQLREVPVANTGRYDSLRTAAVEVGHA